MSEPIINMALSVKGELCFSCQCDKTPHLWDKICEKCSERVIKLFDRVLVIS